jgi:hypoxanthine phosphoribosyltransferase
MQEIKLNDKTFVKSIDEQSIQKQIKHLAKCISLDFADKNPLFLAVLNGSFMFASDLMKQLDFPCEIEFIKVSSYQGTSSTHQITDAIGVSENRIANRTVVIIEDIVDTGHTIEHLFRYLQNQKAKEIEVATLLFKPAAYKKELPVNYIAITIPNDFVVGYGLDYNQLGRNLKHIYKLKEE